MMTQSGIPRHTDESYRDTIALLKKDGKDHCAFLMERLWKAQKEIEELEYRLFSLRDSLRQEELTARPKW